MAVNACVGTVSVLVNVGHGNFGPHLQFGVGLCSESVGFADLDGDGSMDLAVSNADSGSVSVLLNEGR